MDQSQQASGAFAIFASMGVAFILILIALSVLLIIAQWKMFTKAGEAGWKSIIPIYSTYVLFKMVWSTQNFWVYLALAVGYSVLGNLTANSDGNMILAILTIIACIALIVWYVRLQINTAKAYGKGTGFGVGLILLPNIFTLILGFGDAKYIGPQE